MLSRKRHMRKGKDMKKKTKRLFCIGGALLILFAVFTLLAFTVDVKNVGISGTRLGFSGANLAVFGAIGQSEAWLTVTDVLGVIVLLPVVAAAATGLIQLIRRKSIKRVDAPIIALGVLYAADVFFYVLFELVIINYAPILKGGEIAASYPSSHTLLAVTVMVSFAAVLGLYLKRRAYKAIAYAVTSAVAALTVIGRLLSGVHWLTDILASLLLSSALLVLFYGLLSLCARKE